MVYYRNKNFIKIKPLLFPDKQFVVIAYKNVVEVHNLQHVVICKLELEFPVVSLSISCHENDKFYFALENGIVKTCDIISFKVKDIMELNTVLKHIYIVENGLLAIQKDGVYLYKNFDLSQMSLVTRRCHDIFAFNNDLLASVHKKELLVKKLGAEKEIRHLMMVGKYERHYSCVACHPRNNTVAAGNSRGEITVWWDALKHSSNTSRFHWHFLELNCLEFSSLGEHLLTGGKEQVFVKWELSVQESDRQKRTYPRLESHINNIGSFQGETGEYYLLTMADHSYHVITSNMGLINSYRSLVQRSEQLHRKIALLTNLSSVGVLDGSMLPGKLSSSLVCSGHEGKLQFIDRLSNEVIDQLDVACQNWPTESENDSVPGFIQVKKAALSHCGMFIATFEKLGVSQNQYDEMSNVRLFQWSPKQEKFVQEAILPWENMDSVVDMLFHPSNSAHLVLVSKGTKLFIVSKSTTTQSSWKLVHTVMLDEVLRRHNIGLDHFKRHYNATLSTVVTNHNASDGLLAIGSNGALALYLWSHLILGKSQPLAANRMHVFLRSLRMGKRAKERFEPDIVSLAVAAHSSEVGRYRVVCGLHRGMLVIEAVATDNSGSLTMNEASGIVGDGIEGAVGGTCRVALNPSNGRDVAAMFVKDGRMARFDIWGDHPGDSDGIQYEMVPSFSEITWTRSSSDEDKWVVAGLVKKDYLVELATLETPLAYEITKATEPVGMHLLANVDEEDAERPESKPILTTVARDAERRDSEARIRAMLGHRDLGLSLAFNTHYSTSI